MSLALDPLYAFVFYGLFSPGPNVTLLTASGARFGFRRTVPHLLGVAVGVGIVAGIAAVGIGSVILLQPGLATVLKVIAAGWILWMAWGLVAAARRGAAVGEAAEAPWTFWQAILFQWVNPKLWAVTVAASAGFPSGLAPVQEAFRIGSAFSIINFGVCVFWTVAGTLLAWLLTTRVAWAAFNGVMALALAISAIMVFL